MEDDGIAFTIIGSSGTASEMTFSNYDEASKCLEKQRELNAEAGVHSELRIGVQQDPLVVYWHLAETIRNYENSDATIEEPIVVQFLRSNRFTVLPNAELTPTHYGEDPFITWGSVECITDMLVRLGLHDILSGGEDE
jgi:hypothetical protein